MSIATALVLIFISIQANGDITNSDQTYFSNTSSSSPFLDLVQIMEGRACWAIVADSNTVYATFSRLLTVLDISDPSNPIKIAHLPLSFVAIDIILNGNYAYLLDSAAGQIHILDISDPSSPSIISTNTNGTDGARLAISNDILYVAQRWDGLRIIDISNPLNLVDICTFPTTSGAVDIAVQGNHVFIAEYSQGLSVIDVSNPASPTLDTLMTLPGGAKRLDVSDTTAVIASYTLGGATRVIDTRDPRNPIEASTIPADDQEVEIAGSNAYLVDHSGNFSVLDISNPYSASIIGTTVLDEGDRISISGTIAAVSMNESGISIVDITTPTSPTKLSSISSLGDMEKIAIADDYLAIAYPGVLKMLRTDNLNERYSLYAYHGYADDVAGIEIQNEYIYIALNDSWYQIDSGIQIIDISDPTNPFEAAFYRALNQWVWGLDIDGTRTYYSAYDDLIVLDTSDPTNPVELGSFTPGNTIYGIAAIGSYAFLALGSQGLAVVDVSNPDSMSVVILRSFGLDVRELVIDGDYAYLAGHTASTGGLSVIDISDPNDPTEVATFDSGGSAWGITIDGTYLHLTGCADEKYRILDISDPTNPTEIIYYDSDIIKERVAVDPPYVWAISDLHGGLLKFHTNIASAIHFDTPSYLKLKQNYPNPFNPSTTIEFYLPQATQVILSVFDIQGLPIATLINEVCPSGLNRIEWNGLNRFGEDVATGIYIYRIEALGVYEAKKMLYLK